ncbi:hypothetical protein YC2023_022274 [Brassica napus]
MNYSRWDIPSNRLCSIHFCSFSTKRKSIRPLCDHPGKDRTEPSNDPLQNQTHLEMIVAVIGTLLQPAPSPDWEENVHAIMTGTHGLLPSILLRLSFQVSVYYICHGVREMMEGILKLLREMIEGILKLLVRLVN